MNPTKVLALISELAIMPFFPNNNPAALKAVAGICGSMCHNEAEVAWLVDYMLTHYTQWPGPAEMRAVYCNFRKPKDGVNSYSSVYLDGVPRAKTPFPGIAAPKPAEEIKALPAGAAQTGDARMQASIEILSKTNSVARNFGGPATAAEIAKMPNWLRKAEGLD